MPGCGNNLKVTVNERIMLNLNMLGVRIISHSRNVVLNVTLKNLYDFAYPLSLSTCLHHKKPHNAHSLSEIYLPFVVKSGLGPKTIYVFVFQLNLIIFSLDYAPSLL